MIIRKMVVFLAGILIATALSGVVVNAGQVLSELTVNGVTYFNGTIVNQTKNGDLDNPVTIGDNLRVDGRIWRGLLPGNDDGKPVIIEDNLVVHGSITADSSNLFQGPTGPQGPTGIQGPVGSQGPIGPPGPQSIDSFKALYLSPLCHYGNIPKIGVNGWSCVEDKGEKVYNFLNCVTGTYGDLDLSLGKWTLCRSLYWY